MTEQNGTGGSTPGGRVIPAEKYRDGVLMGKIEIHAYTKHGPNAMVSVMPPETLEAGETLKTKHWILGAKMFAVLGEHKKPMKIPGTWYDVRIINQPSK